MTSQPGNNVNIAQTNPDAWSLLQHAGTSAVRDDEMDLGTATKTLPDAARSPIPLRQSVAGAASTAR
jgi:hypothetical protein